MSVVTYQIKKYTAPVSCPEELLVGIALGEWQRSLREQFCDLLVEQTDCVATGVAFPEEKLNQMKAIGSLFSGFCDDDDCGED